MLADVQQARAAEEEKAARYREFTLGKLAYAKGEYPTSIQYFIAALDREGPFSPMGGEIQLWLALGYQVHPPLSIPASQETLAYQCSASTAVQDNSSLGACIAKFSGMVRQ